MDAPECRVDTVAKFPNLRRGLLAVLRDLDPDDWDRPTACGTWDVLDVAVHLLGVDLANVAVRRDRHRSAPPPGVPLGTWLGGFNDDWVRAGRRLGPALVIDLLAGPGRWFDDWAAGANPDAVGPPVSWAGPDPAPVWLDVAREYTERWVHQQQIREATGRAGLDGPAEVGPVVATFAHALPSSLAAVDAAAGTAVQLTVTGPGGGTWHAERGDGRWALRAGPATGPAATLTGDADTAWRMYADYPGVALAGAGDPDLVAAALGGRAIIV